MRLSTGDQGETVRMEDVVFTLNNIVDDIFKIYAGSSNNALLNDCPMEVDPDQLGSEDEIQQDINILVRPDSPTCSEPPMSARSTSSSDSEDTLSLYSPSLGHSPASSGFTTPSSSPTSLTFIDDKDTTDPDPVSIHPLVGVDGNLSPMANNAQIEVCNPLEHAPGMNRIATTTYAPTRLAATSSGFTIAYFTIYSKALSKRRRQWARMTIIYASSLAEPQDLPPSRPVDKYLEWGSYSPSSIGPPRKRMQGAMGRRVHIGPRTLPRGEWDPERKGGTIDRWNNMEVLRRERTRPHEDTKQASRRKLKPVVPLWINTSVDHGKESGTECERQTNEDDLPASSHGIGSTRGNEEIKQERSPTKGDQDTMRLCVKNGKRVSSGTPIDALNSDSGSQSNSDNSGSTAAVSILELPVNDDPNAMRWCVKNGVRVSSQTGNPTAYLDSKLGDSSGIDAQRLASGGAPVAPGSVQNTVSLDQKRPDVECPYVPKKRSPLSRTLLPVSSATMRFQLRTPGDVLRVGKARRKFASMMF
ncbi:unnamed protein product [Rhizoctonia solani]|uniref:Uncharacterized protein n=1 Tax=Rhizoctonia solani TaxID=456999 RepID=A0A8H2XKW9_9AGAM|nr:unnamed protein product [Rhizoctonia solani]